MMKKNIAILGTGSDVGKSILAAALCRSLADRGFKVAPFKSQNMSNNSGITPEGLEMGRAQIVQAEAARIAPHVNMNPILLKPTGEKQSQVILNGEVHGNHTAMDYHRNKGFYFKKSCEAFNRLEQTYDRIILEGAGSCAEVNLMPSDIVNFAMAEYANADVILAADIHRGGVFAQIIGTLACLPKKYRDMVKGFIINRFRGDIALFKDGVDWIEEQTNKKVLGVLPWYTHFKIDAEDSVEIEECTNFKGFDPDIPAIGIIRLPHIANFTDFHALAQIKGLQTIFIDQANHLSKCKAIIIPGSKNTRADLEWLTKNFKGSLQKYYQSKGRIFGICGGYQMLGEFVDDPDGLEGIPGKTEALNLLPVQTVLKAPKTTTVSEFQWADAKGKGYEIHMGYTTLSAGASLIEINSRNSISCADTDGCVSNGGRVAGTYMHGFFDSSQILSKWLKTIGLDGNYQCDDMHNLKERDYLLLKEHFETYIDMDGIL
ncbi:MAG: cobyric acid synthase [Desulfobacula sp.]|jgi:adenosylcobyric acid synthase|uniref:cobyric acid synthase n=1 Tax=Desulfobacula sp. TaxID=2593537 RepID=UPI001DADBA27|nr:cobyric acid synthase [Desulfobacula sp.]MBT3483931.1 cobyric acid synthase [Desulfobacula sp.]MBT3803882.1 cobyric acid synthase [Desulfobacula sp.]MBT4023827.1 cobyric acid synthase [Desulfobacula sp.]MBT4197613.1 cobyric acid synthase [Desulfobacula sp.]